MTREHPIIMSAHSVQAILRGDKTQTRRILKPQPVRSMERCERDKLAPGWDLVHGRGWQWNRGKKHCFWADEGGEPPHGMCPYGREGERLWVREAWAALDSDWHHIHWRNLPREQNVDRGDRIVYRADHHDQKHGDGPDELDWRSPLFMPRWASRLTLQIESVCAERLHDITVTDATAEGIHLDPSWSTCPCQSDVTDPGPHISTCVWRDEDVEADEYQPIVAEFAIRWNELNRKRAPWSANPWVWRIEFRRVES